MLLKNAVARQKALKRFAKTMWDHRLAGRQRLLVNLGVVSESQADRLITDLDSPLPSSSAQNTNRPYRTGMSASKRRIKLSGVIEATILGYLAGSFKTRRMTKKIFLKAICMGLERIIRIGKDSKIELE